jgi:hypothetical protein
MRSIAAALVVTLGFAAPALADHKGKIAWVEDVEAGFKQAKAVGKPIMLYFTADW